MKSIVRASILLLSLVSLSASQSAVAQSASGRYQFIVEGDYMKYVEFESRKDGDTTIGSMAFTDQTKVSLKEPNDEEPPPPDDSAPEFYVKVEFDSMTVEKNRAVMGGTVRDSSHRFYIGLWVQLVVEDNGVEIKRPDQVTWGFCRPPEGSWIPTDAELKYDDGAFMSWWATDAERKDDVGIPSRSRIASDMRGCEVYTLGAYNYTDLKRWEGDIVVQP